MIQKEKSCNTTYTSCIRINGIPILPPLVSCYCLKEELVNLHLVNSDNIKQKRKAT